MRAAKIFDRIVVANTCVRARFKHVQAVGKFLQR
jgi:hypothetical protein